MNILYNRKYVKHKRTLCLTTEIHYYGFDFVCYKIVRKLFNHHYKTVINKFKVIYSYEIVNHSYEIVNHSYEIVNHSYEIITKLLGNRYQLLPDGDVFWVATHRSFQVAFRVGVVSKHPLRLAHPKDKI